MADLSAVLADLGAECADLDTLVAALPSPAWATATPAQGWTIAHQIAHLAWTDEIACVAATDADRFQAELEAALPRVATFTDEAAAEGAAQPPADILARWRAGRSALVEALRSLPDGAKIPWFGPPMGAVSMATARLMETWAHGLDVADTLGTVREPTDRLRHVAHIGVRARDFAFAVHGRPAPADQFRVELTSPSGDVWSWGPADAAQRVSGPALDFCLLVTRRRNRADLAVQAAGADADAWLDIAQAFAGPPGPGRPAGQFA